MPQGSPVGDRARAITRADVARHAGVSDAVVSFVVNGGPKSVSPSTTARVRAAIEQLGYRPNRTARALASGRTRTLGLVVPDSTNPFYAEYTVALQRAATDRGLALLTVSSGADPGAELRGMLDLCDRQVDGLLVARGTGTGSVAELARRGIRTPVVLIDSAAPLPGFATIGPAAADGTGAVVQHLLGDHDHATVDLIIGDSTDAVTDGREQGWLRAHADRRRRPGRLIRAPFTRQGGYDAGRDLLTGDPRPTAIMTGSDVQAIGLLRACRELGLRVPDDLAVGSFDGTDEARFSAPTLTTALQPVDAMATAALDTLIEAAAPGRHQVFDTEMIIGGSCGCLPW